MPPEVSPDGRHPLPGSETEAPSAPPDVLTIAEAARRLRIGRNSAYEAVRRGELPVVRIGRRLLVPRRALERLLDGDRGDESEGQPRGPSVLTGKESPQVLTTPEGFERKDDALACRRRRR